MASFINTNISSLNAQRNLTSSQAGLTTALQRLSSGLRINSAKDDAAGLSISDRMTSQIRGLNQAARNANDGISVAQTAEGALSEMTNIVQRMRELSIQSANASNTANDRASLQSEVGQLKEELTRIASTTSFNGQNILDGSFQNTTFQVGADANQTIGISIGDSRASALGSNIVTTNNTNNGLAAASRNSQVNSTGAAAVGKALDNVTANGIAQQTLSIKDASGSVIRGGTVSVAANEQVSSIVDKLNKIDGVKAFGSTSMTITGWTPDATNASLSVTVKSGAANVTMTLDGVDSSSSKDATFAALSNAINNNNDLAASGVVAGRDASGNLVIRNNTGADISFGTIAAVGYTAQGSDKAATSVTQAAGSGSETVLVSGQLNVFLANGYSIESSKAGDAATKGLFKGNANTAAVAVSSSAGVAGSISSSGASDNRITSVGSQNLDVGKALGNAAAGANGYTGQTLTIRDANGLQVAGGSITTDDDEQVNSIIAKLNNIAGVKASGYTEATLNSWTSNGTAAVTFDITSGGAQVSLTLDGVTSGSNQTSVFNALKGAINSNAQLQKDGLSASIDSSGNLKLQNSTGADIKIGLTATATTASVKLTGSDLAGAASTAVGTGQTGVVGGQLVVDMAKGYTIESDEVTATSLFDATANSAVARTQSDANAGTGVAAQTLTIQGKTTATVDIAKDSSAAAIAAAVNGQSGATGVTAEAVTKVKLSDISAAGTVSFKLAGSNSEGVTVSALVSGSGSGADLSALASAINSKSSSTGIRASVGDGKSSLILESATGDNISITEFSHSAGSAPSASNINGSVASINVSGVTDQLTGSGGFSATNTSAVTLSSGGFGGNARSTVVGGTVSFKSSENFNVSSNVAGNSSATGNSSLFAGAANTANASGLASIAALDISTVSGAQHAIASLDGALSQIGSIRGNLGAVQNRFTSTIANLQASSENVSAARSRILDADFASETAALSRGQILQQAGTAMLAQANSLPSGVMALLRG